MVRIELASTEREKLSIYRLRYEIFHEELGKNLLGTDTKRRVIFQALDTCSSLIYLKDEHRVIGSLRFVILKHYPFDRFYGIDVSEFRKRYDPSEISNSSLFCIQKNYRGIRVPELFAPFLFDLALDKRTKINICIAPVRCLGFYKGFGYRRFGNEFYYKNAGEYVLPLCCNFNDTKYLNGINSPFLCKKKQSLDIKPHSSGSANSNNPFFF